MALQGSQVGVSCNSTSAGCTDKFGCPSDRAPDFQIKRHDTKPALKVAIEDCDGAFDLSDDNLVVEVNMWANAKLKSTITNTDTYFGLADNIGFEQTMVGDIIVMERVRSPEHMLVLGFDEQNKLIQVQRGYNGTQACGWKKGSKLKIFRLMDAPGEIEVIQGEVMQEDGTTLADLESFLVYEWTAESTCVPGCFWVEFTLLKLEDEVPVSMMSTSGSSPSVTTSIVPSFTPSTLTPADFGCILGEGVEWARRFPVCGEGFLIKIANTCTSELA